MDPTGGPIFPSVHINVKKINRPQYRIIRTLNKSMNPQDRITETLKQPKICIRIHKPLNAQKPHTLRKAIHKRMQNTYNLCKATCIAQSLTQTYTKAVQPAQRHIQLRKQSATDVFLQINK